MDKDLASIQALIDFQDDEDNELPPIFDDDYLEDDWDMVDSTNLGDLGDLDDLSSELPVAW